MQLVEDGEVDLSAPIGIPNDEQWSNERSARTFQAQREPVSRKLEYVRQPGRGHERLGNHELAIENYKYSLAKSPKNTNAAGHLKKLAQASK